MIGDVYHMKTNIKNESQSNTSSRFRRWPAPGKRDPITGLSTSVLTKWRSAGYIKIAVIKMPGAKKGVVMLDSHSLDAFIASHIGGDTRAADTSAAVAKRKENIAKKKLEASLANTNA